MSSKPFDLKAYEEDDNAKYVVIEWLKNGENKFSCSIASLFASSLFVSFGVSVEERWTLVILM